MKHRKQNRPTPQTHPPALVVPSYHRILVKHGLIEKTLPIPDAYKMFLKVGADPEVEKLRRKVERGNEVRSYLELHQKGKTNGSLLATDGIARAYGRRKRSMARKRFQKGHVRLRNTTNPYWEGFYREDVRLPDERVVRKQRAINLGRSTEISSKKLAERKLAETLADVNAIDYRPRPIATVRDFVDMKYKKLILPLRKRTTQHGYKIILARHIFPAFGDKQLVDVTGEDVQEFVTGKIGSGLAWNTVKNIIAVFSAVYAAAVKFRYLKVNPVRSVEMPQEPVKFQPKLPSDKELQQLQDALDEPYRTMVWLTCATGVRVSELLALRWSAIDWQHSCLWVREAVHNGEIDSPKTHRSQRPIRLSKSDLARLKKFRKARSRSKDEDWLFLNTRGTAPFSRITFSRGSSGPRYGGWESRM